MVKEGSPPVDAEGDAETTKDLLQRTALCIRAVEYGYGVVALSLLSVQALDLLPSPECLEIPRESLMYLDRLPDSVLVVGDDAPSGRDDGLGGAVVALQLEDLGRGEGLLEVEDIV